MKYEDRELLDRNVHYCHTRLFEEKAAKDFLQRVGLVSQETCINFKLGFGGGLKDALPDDPDTLNKLKRLGILDDRLNETLKDCLTVPIRSEGKTFASVMGISITDSKEIFLPGQEALFNMDALKASKEVYVTDSVLNALLLYSIGLRETAAVIGSAINDNHLKLFEKYGTKSVTLLVANQNLQKFSKKIKSQGIAVGYIDIDSKSLSRLVVEGLKKDYCLNLVKEAKIDMAEPVIEERGEEIFYGFEDRDYRIRRLDPFRLDCLRVNIKVRHQGLWHLDTVDLYADRQRRNFLQQARKLVRLDLGFLHQDLLRIMDDLENRQAKIILENKDKHKEMPALEKEEAMEFLKTHDITGEILKDFSYLGVVGEESNILLGYLVLLSRKLKTPLSAILCSSMGSGADLIKDALLDVIPEEDIERFTKLSPQGLFYRDELSLQNKALVIDDESSLKELDYILLSLQKKGLSYSVSHKSPETGKLRSHDYKVKGPVSILVSISNLKTVKHLMHHFMLLKIDESIQQTKKILSKQREDETLQGILKEKRQDIVKRKHRNAQRLLKPYTIINPYAEDLEMDETKDARSLQPKYLNLIKAVCLLRQYQKEIKRLPDSGDEYIEVDSLDIEVANYLIKTIIKANSFLSDDAVKVFKDIEDLVAEKAVIHSLSNKDVAFTRKELATFCHLTDGKTRNIVEELLEARNIELVAGSNGRTMQYKMTDVNLVKPCETNSTRSKVHN